MKRVVLLILALLLLTDMAEDGCFGKGKFLPSQYAAKTFLISPLHYDSGKVDSSDTLLSPDCRDMSDPRQFQPVTLIIQSGLKILTYCNICSSGGIPL